MKIKISATLDEEIVKWLKEKSEKEYLSFSTTLNQLLCKVKTNKYK